MAKAAAVLPGKQNGLHSGALLSTLR